MANRYLKAAGGNWNGATVWSATGSDGTDTVAAPTAADEVYLVVGSGQLTINTTAACRRFDATGYANTITHNGYTLTIGDATAPTGGNALILGGTYTIGSTSAWIYFASTENTVIHTINTGGKTVHRLSIASAATAQYKFSGNITLVESFLYNGSGSLDFNDVAVSLNTFSATGTNARTIDFGSSIITCNQTTGNGFQLSSTTNLTVLSNSSMVIFAGTSASISIDDGFDLNGMSFKIIGGAGTIAIINSFTVQDFIVKPTTTKTIAITAGKTLTIAGTPYLHPDGGVVTYTGGTIHKATGTYNIYQMINTSMTFSGATWNTRNNCTLTVSTGLTQLGGNDYINCVSGNDSLVCAYGMYKVAYTNATGTIPVLGEILHGETSGSTGALSYICPYEWSQGAGTVYISYKSAAFHDDGEILHGNTGDGHLTIATDFENAAWATFAGATAAKIAPGDIICISESPVPTVKASAAIVSTTDASPIAVHAHAHGLASGDQTTIAGHETNVAANGVWTVTVSGVDDFTLDTSTGSGAGAGGATGTSTILGIGKGVWTDQPATLPLSANILASTNESGLVNIHIHSHGYNNGDVVYIQNHASTVNAAQQHNGCWIVSNASTDDFTLAGSTYAVDGGATGTVTLCNRSVVKLTTAQTLSVERCQVPWNIANTATVTRDTNYYKDGDSSLKVVKASPSNDTLYAWIVTGTLNLSTWNKLTFWIYNSTAVLANQWEVCLCSGADGTGVQNTFKIPAISSTSRWLPLTLSAEEGASLYNGIQSIAIYSGGSAASTSALYFNNFTACTTSGLNLQSLISKNTLVQGSASSTGYANEGWYGIKNISQDGKVIFLDNDTNSLANANINTRGIGYSGGGGSFNTYIRETIKTALVSGVSSVVQECLDSGTVGNNIQYQGGYNLITGSQTGETFFDGLNGNGYGIYLTAKTYNTLNYLCGIRYNYGVHLSGSSSNTITTLTNANNNNYQGVYFYSSSNNTITTLTNANNNNYQGVSFSASSNNTITTLTNANNNNYYGVYFSSSSNNTITTLTNANNNNYYGVYLISSSNNTIKNGSASGNTVSGISMSLGGINYLKNFSITGTEYSMGGGARESQYVYIENYNLTGYEKCFSNYTTMISKATSLVNGSGKEWQIEITDAIRDSLFPFRHILAPVYLTANVDNIFTIYMKKSHGTNIVAQLVCAGGQIAGIASDVKSTDLTNTTETQVTLTLHPTAAGVVEIEMQAYWGGATANVIFDQLGRS